MVNRSLIVIASGAVLFYASIVIFYFTKSDLIAVVGIAVGGAMLLGFASMFISVLMEDRQGSG